MALDQNLLQETETYARDILENQLDGKYSYHTIEHTLEVIQATETIGRYIDLSPEDLLTLKIASWLHDLGYLHAYSGHEQESMRMARDFLSKHNVDKEKIQQIEGLIEATKLDQEPRTLLEQTIKDADLSNLATPDALENSEKIRKEWEYFLNRRFSDQGWDEVNYQFFKGYTFYTDYGKDVLHPGRKQNLKRLRKRIKKGQKSEAAAARAMLQVQIQTQDGQIQKLKRRLKKIKDQQPDRGIETMFRTTYRTHINLSSIADNKANILLSINAIIISVLFGSVFKDLDASPKFVLWPALLMIFTSLSTMVFAILSTRPKVNSLVFKREDIINKKTNLLFFGNFHNMNLDDYLWGIREMMNDGEYLYGSMSKDIYFLGVVLAKKFRLLRLAYNCFMYGMIAVLSFALTIWLVTSGEI